MTTVKQRDAMTLHPLHAILLAFPLALFASALAADLAYLNTAVIQWSTFAAWLITGALVVGGFVLAWALLGAVMPRRTTRRRSLGYLAAVAMMWLSGLVNAFQHSHDGWSSVGLMGLTLSIVSTLAAFAGAIIGYSSPSVPESL